MSLTLVNALDSTDMVMIDDLYAFEFALSEGGELSILCMDGRDERRWTFTPEQVAAASPGEATDEWKIIGSGSEHRLRLLEAFTAEEDDQE